MVKTATASKKPRKPKAIKCKIGNVGVTIIDTPLRCTAAYALEQGGSRGDTTKIKELLKNRLDIDEILCGCMPYHSPASTLLCDCHRSCAHCTLGTYVNPIICITINASNSLWEGIND